MKKLLIFALLLAAPLARAQFGSFQNNCEVGGTAAVTSGLNSTNKLQGSWPGCLVSVYYHGTTTLVPQLYSDVGITPISNPFTASTVNGNFIFYIANPTDIDVVIGPNPAIPATATMPTFTYSNIPIGGGNGVPTFCSQAFGGKNTPGVDDSAALNAAAAAAFAFSQQSNVPNASGPEVTTCGGQSYFSSTLNLPMNLIYNGFNVKELPALGANTGLRVYNAGIGNPAGDIENSTIVGCGSTCTGSLTQFEFTVGFGLKNDYITEGGGHCVNVINSERMTLDSQTIVIACAQLGNFFGASNEVRSEAKWLDTGEVDIPGGNYVFSPNAPNGVWPGPNQGGPGSPTVLIPYTNRAGVVVDGATDFHFDGAGSMKGSFDQSQLWCRTSSCTAGNGYIEQAHTSPGMIIGGPSIYTATTAAMTTTQLSVAVNPISYSYTALGTAVAPGPTSLIQHYWVDSCADAASFAAKGIVLVNFEYYPPDYVKNSNAVSSIDTGSHTILRGMKEVVQGVAYCGTAAPELQMVSRGRSGGCSTPNGTSCSGNAAIAWTPGVLTAELIGSSPSILDTPDSNLDGYDGPAAGYSIAPDNSTPLVAAEISVGNIPDPYQVPQGCQTSGSVLQLHNNILFNDGTPGFTNTPGIGLIWANSCVTIDVTGENVGEIPNVSFDTTFSSVYLNPFFAFGPSAIVGSVYPNGQSAAVTVRDSDGDRTVSSGGQIQTQFINPSDPVTGAPMPGITASPSYSLYTKAPIAAPPTVTLNPTGGSITPGPNGQSLAVSVAYTLATAFPPGGFNGLYPNSTLTSGGSGYNNITVPSVSIGDVDTSGQSNTLVITGVQSSSTAVGICTSTPLPGSYTVGQPITLSGMMDTSLGVALNSKTFAISSVSTPAGCSNGFSFLTPESSNALTTEVGATTISGCPYFSQLGRTTGGVVTAIGGTSAGNQGYCTAPVGATENLVFSDGVVTSSHPVATGTLVVQGSYQTFSQSVVVNVASGNTNSITVASPPAQPSPGIASSYQVAVGPQEGQYVYATTALGTPTVITSVTYTPAVTTGQSFIPRDCAYDCSWDHQFQVGDGYVRARTFNLISGLGNPFYFNFTPSAFNIGTQLYLQAYGIAPGNCLYILDSSGHVGTTSCGSGGTPFSLNGLTGAVTLAPGANITITPSGNTLTFASTASGITGLTATNPLFSTGGSTPTLSDASGFVVPVGANITCTADDFAVLQAWANLISTLQVPGYLPAGCYETSASITFTTASGATAWWGIQGAGTQTVVKAMTANYPVFWIGNGASGPGVRPNAPTGYLKDIQITGSTTSGSPAKSCASAATCDVNVLLDGAREFVIKNVTHGDSDEGIRLIDSSYGVQIYGTRGILDKHQNVGIDLVGNTSGGSPSVGAGSDIGIHGVFETGLICGLCIGGSNGGITLDGSSQIGSGGGATSPNYAIASILMNTDYETATDTGPVGLYIGETSLEGSSGGWCILGNDEVTLDGDLVGCHPDTAATQAVGFASFLNAKGTQVTLKNADLGGFFLGYNGTGTTPNYTEPGMIFFAGLNSGNKRPLIEINTYSDVNRPVIGSVTGLQTATVPTTGFSVGSGQTLTATCTVASTTGGTNATGFVTATASAGTVSGVVYTPWTSGNGYSLASSTFTYNACVTQTGTGTATAPATSTATVTALGGISTYISTMAEYSDFTQSEFLDMSGIGVDGHVQEFNSAGTLVQAPFQPTPGGTLASGLPNTYVFTPVADGLYQNLPDAGKCRLATYKLVNTWCPASFEIHAAIAAAQTQLPTITVNSGGTPFSFTAGTIVVDPRGSPYTAETTLALDPCVNLDLQGSMDVIDPAGTYSSQVAIWQSGPVPAASAQPCYSQMAGGIRNGSIMNKNYLTSVSGFTYNTTVETAAGNWCGPIGTTNSPVTALTGLELGGDGIISGNPITNIMTNGHYDRLNIQGFCTAIQFGDSYNNSFSEDNFGRNYYNFLAPVLTGASAGGEEEYINGNFSQSVWGIFANQHFFSLHNAHFDFDGAGFNGCPAGSGGGGNGGSGTTCGAAFGGSHLHIIGSGNHLEQYYPPYWVETGPEGISTGAYIHLDGTYVATDGFNFTVTGVTARSAGVSATYSGTFTGGGSNLYAGATFTITGDVTNPGNNGTFVAAATGNTATSLTLLNTGTTVVDSFSGKAAFATPNSAYFIVEDAANKSANAINITGTFNSNVPITNWVNCTTNAGAASLFARVDAFVNLGIPSVGNVGCTTLLPMNTYGSEANNQVMAFNGQTTAWHINNTWYTGGAPLGSWQSALSPSTTSYAVGAAGTYNNLMWINGLPTGSVVGDLPATATATISGFTGSVGGILSFSGTVAMYPGEPVALSGFSSLPSQTVLVRPAGLTTSLFEALVPGSVGTITYVSGGTFTGTGSCTAVINNGVGTGLTATLAISGGTPGAFTVSAGGSGYIGTSPLTQILTWTGCTGGSTATGTAVVTSTYTSVTTSTGSATYATLPFEDGWYPLTNSATSITPTAWDVTSAAAFYTSHATLAPQIITPASGISSICAGLQWQPQAVGTNQTEAVPTIRGYGKDASTLEVEAACGFNGVAPIFWGMGVAAGQSVQVHGADGFSIIGTDATHSSDTAGLNKPAIVNWAPDTGGTTTNIITTNFVPAATSMGGWNHIQIGCPSGTAPTGFSCSLEQHRAGVLETSGRGQGVSHNAISYVTVAGGVPTITVVNGPGNTFGNAVNAYEDPGPISDVILKSFANGGQFCTTMSSGVITPITAFKASTTYSITGFNVTGIAGCPNSVATSAWSYSSPTLTITTATNAYTVGEWVAFDSPTFNTSLPFHAQVQAGSTTTSVILTVPSGIIPGSSGATEVGTIGPDVNVWAPDNQTLIGIADYSQDGKIFSSDPNRFDQAFLLANNARGWDLHGFDSTYEFNCINGCTIFGSADDDTNLVTFEGPYYTENISGLIPYWNLANNNLVQQYDGAAIYQLSSSGSGSSNFGPDQINATTTAPPNQHNMVIGGTGTGKGPIDTTGALPANILYIQGSTVLSAAQTYLSSTIASASTIVPLTSVLFVTGTSAISTITPQANCTANTSCQISLAADPSTGPFTLATGGNIALAATPVAGATVTLRYINGVWY